MNYRNILITGGAGFVGSNLAIKLKQNFEDINVYCLDNLKRRGSELNITRLQENGVLFFHGDVRNKEDFDFAKDVDLIIDCSAEPSVMAGVGSSPEYVINTNLIGTINCLELARIKKANVVFFSTSRVYSIEDLNNLNYSETEKRFVLESKQNVKGVSRKGISEDFPTGKIRSIYGTSKLCSEQLLFEYMDSYGIKGIINRCGVITGPWQMGKVDQGVIVLWIARHFWADKKLSYIGYGGKGKQVRDFIHIDDLFNVLKIQLNDFDKYNLDIFNIGGGQDSNLSLREMTDLCEKITGNKIKIDIDPKNRKNDVPLYITDTSKFQKLSRWRIKKDPKACFLEIHDWIAKNKESLEKILNA